MLKLKECKRHLESYFSFVNSEKHSFSALELGTGWFPILPVAFYLCGARRIFTIDRTNLLSAQRVKEVIGFFIDYAKKDDLAKIVPWVQTDKVSTLRTIFENWKLSPIEELLEKLHIYFMVCDARDTGLKPSSIDLFVSNTTLEYIPENSLQGIFDEFRRLASPGALMSHLIITSDHYADIDHSITPFNFLKYPKWLWRLFNNTWHYQNRLRASDYCKLYQRSGFEVLQTHDDLGSVNDLKKVRIAKDFRHYSISDLLVIRTRIVSMLSKDTPARQTV
jgi:hypothetical protein